MIQNAIFKNYANQIAVIFCTDQVNVNICKASIAERLIQNFTDPGFQKFLGVITTGKTYLVEIKNYRVDTNQNRRYVDIYFTDVITGNITKKTWNWSMTGNYFTQLKSAFSFYNYNLLQGPEIFDAGNVGMLRIYNAINEPTYGISFIPGSVGGGGTGTTYTNTGTGTTTTTNFQKTPDVLPGAPAAGPAGILDDIFNMLKNPVVIAGVIIGGYLIFKGSK